MRQGRPLGRAHLHPVTNVSYHVGASGRADPLLSELPHACDLFEADQYDQRIAAS
jgi:hypothetical protein